MALKVFVGSSVEGLSVAYAVQQNLEHTAEVTIWDQGIFHLSKSALDSLILALDRFDFGVFIFNPDDIVTMRGDQNRTVRDNVVFELGLFVGRLGKDRSFILMPSGQTDFHLPTDLIGVTPATYQADRSDRNLRAATGPSCHTINQAMKTLGALSTVEDEPQGPQSGEPIIKSKAGEARAREVEKGHEPPEEEPDWVSLFFAEKYDEVISALEKNIETGGDEKEKQFHRLWIGRAKAKLDMKSGVEYLTKIKEEDPTWHGPYIAIAEAYDDEGFRDEALATLDAGISAARNVDWLQTTKANILDKEGDTDKALDVLNNLRAKSPEFEYGYSRAAKILTERGRKEEAKKMYEVGLKFSPKNLTLLREYGELLSDEENDEAALTVFKRLTEIDSKNSNYLTRLGNAYLKLGLNGLAMEAYQKANELAEGKEAWIIGNIGNLFNNRGFYPLAIEYFKRALALDAGSAYTHERLSNAIKKDLEERKRADEIIRQYKETIKQRVSDSEVTPTLATAVEGPAS